MKRILLIVRSSLCVGGVTKVLLDLTRNLNHKYIFEVLTLTYTPGEFDSEFLESGVRLHKVHTFDADDCGMLFFLRPLQIEKS